MMPALFYGNAMLQGWWGMSMLTKPHEALGQETFHADGWRIINIFVPSYVANACVSALMAKQEDNVNKQLYCVSWFVYHINAARNCWNERQNPVVAFFFGVHTAFALGFGYYLRQTKFKPASLLPF